MAGVCGADLPLRPVRLRRAAGGQARPRAPTPRSWPPGITSLVLSQALLNLFAVLGLAPLTGVPLPFISYGSTNLVVLLAGDGPAAERRPRGHRPPARGQPARAGAIGHHPAPMAETYLIAAGGTAGHVVPALAVADALRADGARVVFAGGERAEAELVPGRRLRAATAPGRGAQPHEPAQGGARRGAGGRRGGHRARGSSATSGPARCWAAAGTSPGRSGAAAVAARVPLVLTEADSHLGLDQPPAGAVRAARLPGLPARRARRRRATGSPGARCRRRRPTAPAARGALRRRRGRSACVLVFGGSLGARSINEAAVDGLRRRAVPRPARQRHARPRRAARAAGRPGAGRLRPARLHPALRRRRSPRPTSSSRAPGGSIFEVAAHGRPAILVPYPHAAADHQTANARWMAARRAPRSSCPTPSSTPRACAREVDALLGDPARLAAMAPASAALARPRAAREVADELRAAAAAARG